MSKTKRTVKPSEIYLRAAELIASRRRNKYSCLAIADAAVALGGSDYHSNFVGRYSWLFAPEYPSAPARRGYGSWLHREFTPELFPCEASLGDVYTAEMHEWRLTALCLMAAICASEGE